MSFAQRWTSISLDPVKFVLLAMLWGTSFVAIEVGIDYFPPILFAAVRYGAAGLLVFGYAAVVTDRLRPRGREEWLGIAVGGAFVIAAYHGLLYLGQRAVPGAIAAVVVSLSPVLTAVFAGALLDGERLEPIDGVGFLLGLAGVIAVARPDPSNLASADAIGIGLVFAGAAAFALGGVLTRPLRTDLPVESMQAWTMLAGAVALAGWSGARGESLAAVEWTLPAVASLAYLTVFSGAVAFLLYFDLLDAIGPSELHLIGYLEPAVATLMSWVVFGRVVDAATVAGFGAIVVGFAVVERRPIRRRIDAAVDDRRRPVAFESGGD